eukprot:Clim_evm134s157 gene=Clim_evmTU134s157
MPSVHSQQEQSQSSPSRDVVQLKARLQGKSTMSVSIDKISEWIEEGQEVITVPIVARRLHIHPTFAKQLLYAYAHSEGASTSMVVWSVFGTRMGDKYSSHHLVVNENLKTVLGGFEEVEDASVYSVGPAITDHKAGSIRQAACREMENVPHVNGGGSESIVCEEAVPKDQVRTYNFKTNTKDSLGIKQTISPRKPTESIVRSVTARKAPVATKSVAKSKPAGGSSLQGMFNKGQKPREKQNAAPRKALDDIADDDDESSEDDEEIAEANDARKVDMPQIDSEDEAEGEVRESKDIENQMEVDEDDEPEDLHAKKNAVQAMSPVKTSPAKPEESAPHQFKQAAKPGKIMKKVKKTYVDDEGFDVSEWVWEEVNAEEAAGAKVISAEQSAPKQSPKKPSQQTKPLSSPKSQTQKFGSQAKSQSSLTSFFAKRK